MGNAEAQRSENMRRIRSGGTRPEVVVRRMVWGLGYRYRLHRQDLPGRPDLVFASRKLIIFVHGCFWHVHARCKRAHEPRSNRSYWLPKLERNRRRDQMNRKLLVATGWKVLIIWECEIFEAERIRTRIAAFLRQAKD